MKILKVMIMVALFATLLTASSLEYEKKFEIAKSQFDSKDYEKAYNSFHDLFLSNLQDPNVNFYLGRSAFMLGKYEDAVSAYDRVLFVDETSNRAKLELARSYLKLGGVNKAKELFLEVRKTAPVAVQENVDKYLAAIESAREKHSLHGAVIAGVNYDTNIYSQEAGYISDITGILNVTPTASKGSLAHQEVVAANYAYAKSDTVKYKVDTVLFNKTIFSYHDMDLNLIQVTPAISVMYDKKLSVDYALFANKIWLRRAPLMVNWGLNPKMKYKYSPTWMFDTAFKLQIQKNAPHAFQRDNTLYSLEGGTKHVYNDKLTLGAKAKIDLVREKHLNEKNGAGANIESNEVGYNLYDLTLDATYKYAKNIMIAPKVKYYKKNYLDPKRVGATTYNKIRSDSEFQMWLSGTYIYSPKRLFTFEYVHSKHSSNYIDHEFKKDTFSANVIIPF